MFGLGGGVPSAIAVADRALALRAICIHALAAPPSDVLQELKANWDDAEWARFCDGAEQDRAEHVAQYEVISGTFTPWERDFLSTSSATMTQRQHLDAMWRLEAFQVLVWSLRFAPSLPAYDTQASTDQLKVYPPEEYRRFRRSARLRPKLEIAQMRDLAELWHWRSRTRQLIEDGAEWRAELTSEELGITSYDGLVRYVAQQAHEKGDLPGVVDEDFVAFGKSYRDLTDDEWSNVRSVTMERHFALNWLCGYAPKGRWDETPTDT